MGLVIEIHILQALAFQGKKNTDRPLAALETAILLAQPEGFVRMQTALLSTKLYFPLPALHL